MTPGRCTGVLACWVVMLLACTLQPLCNLCGWLGGTSAASCGGIWFELSSLVVFSIVGVLFKNGVLCTECYGGKFALICRDVCSCSSSSSSRRARCVLCLHLLLMAQWCDVTHVVIQQHSGC